MRIELVLVGLCLVVISIPAYLDTPQLMSQMIHSFVSTTTGNIPGGGGGSMLHQMGYPSRTVIIPLIQYSFIGLAFVGIGMVMYGCLAQKIPKQLVVKVDANKEEKEEKVEKNRTNSKYTDEVTHSPQFTDERTQTNLRSLRILQERLAKGEITAKEFQNLKRLME